LRAYRAFFSEASTHIPGIRFGSGDCRDHHGQCNSYGVASLLTLRFYSARNRSSAVPYGSSFEESYDFVAFVEARTPQLAARPAFAWSSWIWRADAAGCATTRAVW
jgi:hypothetical protein